MSTNLRKKQQVIEANIETITRLSELLVKEIIEANSKNISLAIEKNKIVIDKIREKVIAKNMDPKIMDVVYKTMVSSVLLAEEMIDNAIDDHQKNIDQITQSYQKIVESFNQQHFNDQEESNNLFELVTLNFEESIKNANDRLSNQIKQYNKHANFALNFNRNFSENINYQIEFLHDFNHNNIFQNINNWVSEWNKQTIREKVEFN